MKERTRKLKLITTDDGSHSIFVPDLNETYHSFHGAIQESRYVFINMGLKHFREQHSVTNIRVLEVGLGTGLNALLTAEWSNLTQQQVTMTTLEPYPVDQKLINQLNYTSYVDSPESAHWLSDIHSSKWNEPVSVNDQFKLIKIGSRLEEVSLEMASFDVIYFDAFAPSKQAEMWSSTQLAKVYELQSSPSYFVTYSATGQLKRDLRDLGLEVETLPGPPGKKEMVRAKKIKK